MTNRRAAGAVGVVGVVVLIASGAGAIPLGAGFTYQGQLTDAGAPANGGYDFRFTLHTCDVVGGQVGPTVELDNVDVNNGVFTVYLNFGAVFTNEARCLEIGVRPGSATGGDPYTVLDPRQQLTAAPFSLYAATSGGAPWSGLTGLPAGFADQVDNDTTYVPGTGLDLVDNQFRIDFGGSGFAPTVAHSDHTHTSTGWQLSGNSGTTPGTNFLGTTDNTALQLHVGNVRALRLEPGGTSPNLIGGHSGNTASASVQGAAISGGGENGAANRVTDSYGTVGGGRNNQAGDGAGSVDDRRYATVGGGSGNRAMGDASTVAGGTSNDATAVRSVIGGGLSNVAGGSHSAIGGGEANVTGASHSTVGGGRLNEASGNHSGVGGGESNLANGDYATIGGGFDAKVDGDYATVGGGTGNTAAGDKATIGGGDGNDASATYSTIAGGIDNAASEMWSAVGGGWGNSASGQAATVAGGGGNVATGAGASVGGGSNNRAAALGTVPGGADNEAGGSYSFAAGRKAKALGQGTFAWADSTNADFTVNTDDQFAIRAANGLRLSVNAGGSKAVGIGEHYRDNAIVAWGKVVIGVDNQPSLQEDFGVTSVTRTAAGNYAVNLNITAGAVDRLIPVAVAEVEAPPAAAADIRIVSVEQIDADTFRVYINRATGPLVDNDFVFMVTAR